MPQHCISFLFPFNKHNSQILIRERFFSNNKCRVQERFLSKGKLNKLLFIFLIKMIG